MGRFFANVLLINYSKQNLTQSPKCFYVSLIIFMLSLFKRLHYFMKSYFVKTPIFNRYFTNITNIYSASFSFASKSYFTCSSWISFKLPAIDCSDNPSSELANLKIASACG